MCGILWLLILPRVIGFNFVTKTSPHSFLHTEVHNQQRYLFPSAHSGGNLPCAKYQLSGRSHFDAGDLC